MSDAQAGGSGADDAAGPDAEPRAGFPRWALFFMIPGVAGPILILAFILRTERAHDEASCPFTDGAQRRYADGVVVQEQVRSCLPGIQERRYVIVRDDERKLLGRRRFADDAFGEGYGFDGGVTDAGEVHIKVHNPGHPPQPFREGNAADDEAWGGN